MAIQTRLVIIFIYLFLWLSNQTSSIFGEIFAPKLFMPRIIFAFYLQKMFEALHMLSFVQILFLWHLVKQWKQLGKPWVASMKGGNQRFEPCDHWFLWHVRVSNLFLICWHFSRLAVGINLILLWRKWRNFVIHVVNMPSLRGFCSIIMDMVCRNQLLMVKFGSLIWFVTTF